MDNFNSVVGNESKWVPITPPSFMQESDWKRLCLEFASGAHGFSNQDRSSDQLRGNIQWELHCALDVIAHRIESSYSGPVAEKLDQGSHRESSEFILNGLTTTSWVPVDWLHGSCKLIQNYCTYDSKHMCLRVLAQTAKKGYRKG